MKEMELNMRKRIFAFGFLTIFTCALLLPIIVTVVSSLMAENEIRSRYGAVLGLSGFTVSPYAKVTLFSDFFTFTQYKELVTQYDYYFILFWNSVKISVGIIVGQLIVAPMAAFAFSKLNFPYKNVLFLLYILILLMPYQVTFLPNYIVVHNLGLLNTQLSVILIQIFSPMGVFLLRLFIDGISNSYIEAAQLDGASWGIIYYRIILPLIKPTLATLTILLFIDSWNLVEQPLMLISKVPLLPLSVFLTNMQKNNLQIAFGSSVIYLIPSIILFLYAGSHLTEWSFGGIKE